MNFHERFFAAPATARRVLVQAVDNLSNFPAAIAASRSRTTDFPGCRFIWRCKSVRDSGDAG